MDKDGGWGELGSQPKLLERENVHVIFPLCPYFSLRYSQSLHLKIIALDNYR